MKSIQTENDLRAAFLQDVHEPSGVDSRAVVDRYLTRRPQVSRRRSKTTPVILAAAAVVGVVLFGFIYSVPGRMQVAARPTISYAPVSPIQDWPARGPWVHESNITSTSASAARRLAPESEPQLLWAGPDTLAGTSAMLAIYYSSAVDGAGLVIFLTASPEGSPQLAQSSGLDWQNHVSIQMEAGSLRPNSIAFIENVGDHSIGRALLAPEVQTASFRTAMTEIGDGPEADGAMIDGTITSSLPELASPWNTWVTTDHGMSGRVTDTKGNSPKLVDVENKPDGTPALRPNNDDALKLGDLVAWPGGVLGIVDRVNEDGTGSFSFDAADVSQSLRIFSYISNHPGTLRYEDTDASVYFVPVDSNLKSDVNRVLGRVNQEIVVGLGQVTPGSFKLQLSPLTAENVKNVFVVHADR